MPGEQDGPLPPPKSSPEHTHARMHAAQASLREAASDGGPVIPRVAQPLTGDVWDLLVYTGLAAVNENSTGELLPAVQQAVFCFHFKCGICDACSETFRFWALNLHPLKDQSQRTTGLTDNQFKRFLGNSLFRLLSQEATDTNPPRTLTALNLYRVLVLFP